jgi:hypothetical protein
MKAMRVAILKKSLAKILLVVLGSQSEYEKNFRTHNFGRMTATAFEELFLSSL